MTTDERLERIERAVETLITEVRGIREDVTRLDHRITALENRFEGMESRLEKEVARWDERFFQLSKDTLTFTRAVVTTAAVVAVLVPALRDVAPLLIELVKAG